MIIKFIILNLPLYLFYAFLFITYRSKYSSMSLSLTTFNYQVGYYLVRSPLYLSPLILRRSLVSVWFLFIIRRSQCLLHLLLRVTLLHLQIGYL